MNRRFVSVTHVLTAALLLFVTGGALRGQSCSFTLNPTSSTPGSAAASGLIFALAASSSGCGWTASTTASWVTVVSTSGTGSATITYNVAANPGNTARSAFVIAGNVASQV